MTQRPPRSDRHLARIAVAVLAAGVLVSGQPAAAAPAAPPSRPAGPEGVQTGWFDETTLWDSTTEDHENFHVHALVVTPDGTILAFTEGRFALSDGGPKDILLRRSTDGGATWEPTRAVVPSGGQQFWSNPTALVDEQTGDAFLFFQGPTSAHLNVIRSGDSGATWSEPVDLSDLFTDNPHGWILNGPGPGHGIQLDSGRLILPMLHRRSVDQPVDQRRYGIDTLYSDDHGRTWQRGGQVPVSPDYPINESRLWQRADGAVVVNGRAAAGGHRHRISAVSTDGGQSWSAPVREPATGRYTAVDSGAVRFEGPDGVGRLLHSRPDGARRENLTVAISYDDGYTYRYERTIHPGPSYYSDLAVLSDGTIVLLYGRDGEIFAFPERIALARFDLAWLTGGRDTGADGPGLREQEVELGTTEDVRTGRPSGLPGLRTISPDRSDHHGHAVVTGEPSIVDGRVGSALELDTADQLVVPRSRALAGAGETFTAAAWFRTTDQSSQAILWANGWGSGTPQWWIRLEPGNNRVRALLDTGYRTRGLTAPGNFADGDWHHAALTRDATTLALYLDGDKVAEAESPFGSSATGAREGLYIGQRPDGANPLNGTVDEVHLYDRALTGAQVAAIAGGAPETAGGAVLRLPMDKLRVQPVPPARPAVVDDANARGGSSLTYPASGPGDFVEVPFSLTEGHQAFEVAVRYHRYWDRGKVRISIDGQDLPDGLVDPSLATGEAYQTYQFGTAGLEAGAHRIRFTLEEAGRLGGSVIAPDHLTLISGGGPHDLVRDVVVDDESVGDFQLAAGRWGRASGQAGHPYYGVSYRSAPAGSGERRAEYRPDVPVTGDYQVLAWWVSHPNRASDAPYTIRHAGGSTTVRVDQRGQARSLSDRERPGVWVDLGTYRFEAGSAGTVELSNDADGYVIADAVMLTRDPVPQTPAGLAATGVSASSIQLLWTASDGATGYHVERRVTGGGAWEFAGQVPAGQTAFTSTGLSPGTTYEHRVYAVVDTEPGRPARGSLPADPVAATTAAAGGGNDEAAPCPALAPAAGTAGTGRAATPAGSPARTCSARGYAVMSSSLNVF